MTDRPNAPFDRVENGYDPQQVATFAANALSWKRDLAAARTELARYAQVIGTIEAVEREATEIIEEAQRTAAEILEMAASPSPVDLTEYEPKSEPEPEPEALEHEPDPVDVIFEATAETPDEDLTDEAAELDAREQRIAAAAANLWKRRGVLTQME